MEPQEYDEIMRTLAAIQERMHGQERMDEMHRSMERLIQEQKSMIPRLDAMIARFDARIARLDRDQDNGRDA